MLSDEYKRVFGRLLADQGCKNLFKLSPPALMKMLDVDLTNDEVIELRQYIDRLENSSVHDASVISGRLGGLQRWKIN